MRQSFTVGDRIRLTKMDNDPCPIEVGAEGTIEQVQPDMYSVNSRTTGGQIVTVKWDNGRTLRLIWPEDQFDVIEETT